MAYDEDLAERVRLALGERDDVTGVTEKKMFGGLGFMVGGHMAVAVSGQGGLMLRCDPVDTADLLAREGAEPMEMRGKELSGWLRVRDDAVETDEALAGWVAVGAAHVVSLPPK